MGDEPRLADLSEEEILARVLPAFGMPGGRVIVPPGDDAAVLATPGGSVVATTDSMVRDRDWRDDWSSAGDVAAKLVTQNVADIAAMGAVPTGLLVAVSADPATEVAWLVDLARGIAEAAEPLGCVVIGGDLSSAPSGIVVAVTALGDLEGRAPVLRSGARAGDIVAVCGSLGRSGAGWLLLEQGLSDRHPDGVGRLAVDTHRAPPATQLGAGPVVAGVASAMVDLSDGLVRDLGRVAQASGVGVELSRAGLAWAVDEIAPVVGEAEAWRQVLGGGEEHSLLATFPVGTALSELDPRHTWRVIGQVREAWGDPRVTLDGEPLRPGGWDHFAG